MLSLSQILIIPITVSASYHCRTVQLILQNMRIFSLQTSSHSSAVQRHVMRRSLEHWDASATILEKVWGASGGLFSEQFLWWRAESTQNISKLSDKQQNIFRRRRNQRGSFLCGLGKVYSWSQILTGTNDCLQLTVQRIAKNPYRSFPELRAAFYTDIYCMYYTDQQTKTPKMNIITESQRSVHIWEARTWKCFALLLRKWLKRLKKPVAD